MTRYSARRFLRGVDNEMVQKGYGIIEAAKKELGKDLGGHSVMDLLLDNMDELLDHTHAAVLFEAIGDWVDGQTTERKWP